MHCTEDRCGIVHCPSLVQLIHGAMYNFNAKTSLKLHFKVFFRSLGGLPKCAMDTILNYANLCTTIVFKQVLNYEHVSLNSLRNCNKQQT